MKNYKSKFYNALLRFASKDYVSAHNLVAKIDKYFKKQEIVKKNLMPIFGIYYAKNW